MRGLIHGLIGGWREGGGMDGWKDGLMCELDGSLDN